MACAPGTRARRPRAAGARTRTASAARSRTPRPRATRGAARRWRPRTAAQQGRGRGGEGRKATAARHARLSSREGRASTRPPHTRDGRTADGPSAMRPGAGRQLERERAAQGHFAHLVRDVEAPLPWLQVHRSQRVRHAPGKRRGRTSPPAPGAPRGCAPAGRCARRRPSARLTRQTESQHTCGHHHQQHTQHHHHKPAQLSSSPKPVDAGRKLATLCLCPARDAAPRRRRRAPPHLSPATLCPCQGPDSLAKARAVVVPGRLGVAKGLEQRVRL